MTDCAHDTRESLDQEIVTLEEQIRDARAEADHARRQPGLEGPAKSAEDHAGRLAAEVADLRQIVARVGVRAATPRARGAAAPRQSRRNLLRAINVASEHACLWSEEDGSEPADAHDLRHSLAAYAFSIGTLPEVSRLLRHANSQVTATVYADLAGNAVEALQERLSGLSEAATA